jgi:hypothetical protein
MSLKIAVKVISKLFWMILHKKQNPERVTYIKLCTDRKKITVETVNSVVNKLYEGLNHNDIISERARFLNTEKMKLLKERFCSAD